MEFIRLHGPENTGKIYYVVKAFNSARGKMYHLKDLNGKSLNNVTKKEIRTKNEENQKSAN